EENRRILLDGLPKAGFDKILPVDGAFYLYADVSRFTDDSLEFAQRMLAHTHVAATPGVDFDPLRGRHFIRFCYAGAAAEMHEAVERITTWLKSWGRARGGIMSELLVLRRPRPPAIVPPLLSFTAGFIDSFTVLALFGLFVAQVTGSFVLTAVAIVTNEPGALTKLLAIPVFLLAAVATTVLAVMLERRGRAA